MYCLTIRDNYITKSLAARRMFLAAFRMFLVTRSKSLVVCRMFLAARSMSLVTYPINFAIYYNNLIYIHLIRGV